MATPSAEDQALVAAFVTATREMTVDAIKEVAGVPSSSLARYRAGTWQRLHPDTRKSMREFLEATGRAQMGGDGRGNGLNLPNVDYLKPQARQVYERKLGSFVQRGWPAESIERASRELVASIVGANTLRAAGAGRADLSDDEQVMVLEGVARHIDEVYGPNGIPRRT